MCWIDYSDRILVWELSDEPSYYEQSIWHTYVSVIPQLLLLAGGFRSKRLINGKVELQKHRIINNAASFADS